MAPEAFGSAERARTHPDRVQEQFQEKMKKSSLGFFGTKISTLRGFITGVSLLQRASARLRGRVGVMPHAWFLQEKHS